MSWEHPVSTLDAPVVLVKWQETDIVAIFMHKELIVILKGVIC